MMAYRRRSTAELPFAPLELLHPLDLPGGEIEGRDILREMPTADGSHLWVLFRVVLGWTARQDDKCHGDVQALIRLEREMLERGADPFAAPCGLLAGYMAHPCAARKEEVAWACICLAEWAQEEGFAGIAEGFSKLSAYAWPRNARYAVLAAHVLFVSGKTREAESWFTRAHKVAIWTDDWTCQVRALLGRSDVMVENGSPEAGTCLRQRAIELARRRGCEDILAERWLHVRTPSRPARHLETHAIVGEVRRIGEVRVRQSELRARG